MLYMDFIIMGNKVLRESVSKMYKSLRFKINKYSMYIHIYAISSSFYLYLLYTYKISECFLGFFYSWNTAFFK